MVELRQENGRKNATFLKGSAMRIATVVCIVGVMVVSLGAFPAQGAPEKADRGAMPKHPAFFEPRDDPALPRVLLIGDSISIGYTVAVRKSLCDKANVHRIPMNGGPTSRGLDQLDKWLGDGRWDLIHFNWGLHDLKRMEDGKHQVPIEQYEKNLRELARRLKHTGAKLIWASTTPVPNVPAEQLRPPRHSDDVVAYNAVAKRIMDQDRIPINDLYAFALPRLADTQLENNVHFTIKGYAALAEQVTAAIVAVLAGKPVPPPKEYHGKTPAAKERR